MKEIKSIILYYSYLIIPISCFFFWAILSLIKDHFILEGADYPIFYYTGKYIFSNPEFVYNKGYSAHYYYLPIFATIFSILTLFDYSLSQWIYFFILLVFGFLSIILFNKILIFKNVKNKFIRFLFLMVISNGYRILVQFDYLNTKIICLFLLLLFIKREIEIREFNINSNSIKFLSIQFTILGLIVSLFPPLIFIVLIYFFNGIKIKEIFKKFQIKKYSLFFIILICQNFMFLMYPPLIFGFLRGLSHVKTTNININNLTPEFIIEKKPYLPVSTLLCLGLIFNIDWLFLTLISIIVTTIFTVIISFKENIMLEYKFGYFALFSFFFNVYIKAHLFLVLIPFILFLFVEKIENIAKFEDFSIISFIKNNYLLLIGLLSLCLLMFIPPLNYLYRVIPITKFLPLPIMLLIFTYIYIIIVIDLYYFKKKILLYQI